jgi:hypothetical protein
MDVDPYTEIGIQWYRGRCQCGASPGLSPSRNSGVPCFWGSTAIMRSTRSALDDMRRRDRPVHTQRRLVNATQCRATSAPQRQSTESIAMMPLLGPGRPYTMTTAMTTAMTMTTTMTTTPTATTRNATGSGGTCNTLSARFITRPKGLLGARG